MRGYRDGVWVTGAPRGFEPCTREVLGQFLSGNGQGGGLLSPALRNVTPQRSPGFNHHPAPVSGLLMGGRWYRSSYKRIYPPYLLRRRV
jgi:hypothetical protein